MNPLTKRHSMVSLELPRIVGDGDVDHSYIILYNHLQSDYEHTHSTI